MRMVSGIIPETFVEDFADSFSNQSALTFIPPGGFERMPSINGLHFRRRGSDLFLNVIDTGNVNPGSILAPIPDALRDLFPKLPSFVDSEVSFGIVAGKKRSDFQTELARADYILRVPGGWVQVLLQWQDDCTAEADVERQLATIRLG
jgi:hypothetical protein